MKLSDISLALSAIAPLVSVAVAGPQQAWLYCGSRLKDLDQAKYDPMMINIINSMGKIAYEQNVYDSLWVIGKDGEFLGWHSVCNYKDCSYQAGKPKDICASGSPGTLA